MGFIRTGTILIFLTVGNIIVTANYDDVCEDDELKIVCENSHIFITDADYGASTGHRCNKDYKGPSTCSTGFRAKLIMQAKCNERSECTVEASNEVFEDECPGEKKYLTANWVCGEMTCKAGTYRDFGMTYCIECPTNSISSRGARECTDCAPGTVANIDKSQCEKCPAGKYRRLGMTTCAKCESDTNGVSETPGAEMCTTCPAGTVANEDRTKCETCGSGGPNCPNFCEGQKEKDIIYGNYTWPNTPLGLHAEIPCFYNEEKIARKFCDSSTREFGKTNFEECKSSMDEEVSNISRRADNMITEADQLEVIQDTQITTKDFAEAFDSEVVKKIAEILNKVIDFDAESDRKLSDTVRDDILLSVDNMLKVENYDVMAKNGAAPSVRASVEKFTDKISKHIETSSDRYLNEQTIAIVVPKITDDGTFFKIKVSGEESQLKNSNFSQDESDDSDALFSARVPGNTEKSQVTTALYETPIIYPDNSTTTGQDITSIITDFFSDLFKPIIAVSKVASVIAEVKYANIAKTEKFANDDRVNMNFLVKDGPSQLHYLMALRPSYQCVYYNTDTGSWVQGEESGCESTVATSRNGSEQVTCSCDHMTSFAVLMSFDSDYDPAERIVTTLLLAASLVCLILTILAYLPLKDMRRRRSVKTHIFLAISFILSAAAFYSMEHGVNINRIDNRVPTETDTASNPCLFIAFLVNYLWLCQMAWMVCEAAMLYLDLVIVFNNHIKRFLLKSNLMCWGIPLLFPIIGIIWGREDFANPTTCFIRRNYGLVTFYAPVILCILFNILIFIRIFMSIFWQCTVGKGMKDANSTTAKRTLKRRKQFKFAVTLTTILGLAWVLGFFLIIDGESTIWTRWLFIVFNSSQGIFIFILYVVLNDELKKAWKNILKSSKTSKYSSSSTGATKSTGLGKKKPPGKVIVVKKSSC